LIQVAEWDVGRVRAGIIGDDLVERLLEQHAQLAAMLMGRFRRVGELLKLGPNRGEDLPLLDREARLAGNGGTDGGERLG